MQQDGQLARRIGLPLLTFYGLGTILGAGIYVLVGKVSAASGLLAPLSFILAAVVAGVTALSYSQLVVLYPKSAGEAFYVEEGFHQKWLTLLVGYLVVFTGIVSAATLAHGFIGYLSVFISFPRVFGITLVILLMAAIAVWGIAESLWLAALITVVEVIGLLLVIYFSSESFFQLPHRWQEFFVPVDSVQWGGVLGGAFLAFYAFIGFEDMVNVVEEVKQPRKQMPKAIFWALVVSSLLYVLIAIVAVLGLPLEQLQHSQAPLRDILQSHTSSAGIVITVIGLFAILNGVLTQIIMASRVLYGMAHQGRAPNLFRKVWARTKTPWLATIIVFVLIWAFALWLPLIVLAKTTSFIILCVFALVNIALIKLKREKKIEPALAMFSLPMLGAILCLGLLAFQLYSVSMTLLKF